MLFHVILSHEDKEIDSVVKISMVLKANLKQFIDSLVM
jgi:hypothetical protein